MQRQQGMLSFDRYEVLSFDCYGTLIDWDSGILAAIHPVLSNHNFSLSDAEILQLYADFETRAEQENFRNYKSILNTVMAEMGRALGFRPSEADLTCLIKALQTWRPFPDVVESLQALRSKYQLAILSNTDDDLFSATANHLQTGFEWIITSQQLKSYKPSLNNFRQMIKRIAIPEERLLHVAQSIFHDIIPAKKIGLATVWVNRPSAKQASAAPPLVATQPDLEVTDLTALVSAAGIK